MDFFSTADVFTLIALASLVMVWQEYCVMVKDDTTGNSDFI